MLIHLGRLLMLLIWVCLGFNLFFPFPKPLNYFLYFALAFMAIMHFLKVLMVAFIQSKSEPLTLGHKIRLFFFGVFELIPIYKRQKALLAQTGKTSSETNHKPE